MIELREYQAEALDALFNYWAKGGGNPLVDICTGGGKSLVIGTLCQRLLETYRDLRILNLVHIRELVTQDAMALLRQWPGAPIGINSAGLGRRDRFSKVLFASIQSVFREDARSLGRFDVVLIDEAHLIPRSGEGMYRTFLDKLRDTVPDLRVAGFTATPYRLDSGRLDAGAGRLFDETVYTYGIGDGVRDGFLAPLVSKATGSEIDVSGVQRRGGEFVSGSLERAADKEQLVAAAVKEIVERGADRRTWLVFCTGIEHAYHVRDAIRGHGISCETLTGETPAGERDALLKAFKEGRLRALANVKVATTGLDVPGVDLIATLAPTLSTSLYLQRLGRGTRPITPPPANLETSEERRAFIASSAKPNTLVLDFGGDIRRFGPVDDVFVSTPRGDASKEDREGAVKPETVRAKVCPGCGTYVGVATLTCLDCGNEWPKPQPKHDAVADTAPIMSGGEPVWIAVSERTPFRHIKNDFETGMVTGFATLRVEYACGLSIYQEWLAFDHKNAARVRAEAWWRAMGGASPLPDSVTEAMARFGELNPVSAITIKRDGKFWRVSSYRVTRRDGREVEIDERLRVRPVAHLEEAA